MRIFVFGFACPGTRCGGMAACVGVGTDIRHPLERDRRALTPLSRTRNSDRVTHWQWEACDYGAFDGDSIVIRPPPPAHSTEKLIVSSRVPYCLYFRKSSNTQRHENAHDDGVPRPYAFHIYRPLAAEIDRALSTSSRPLNVLAHPRTDCETKWGAICGWHRLIAQG